MASPLFITFLFGSCIDWATASAVSTALEAIREAYTTNAICMKKNCINPVFPGMEDLHRLQQAKWITSTLQKTAPSMGFCRNAISYDPALPMPDSGGSLLHELVERQDNAASTMFYYHLAGLGMEAWDYQKPEEADDCTKSIWRMVCFTYFPRAQIGLPEGAFSDYIRPCKSSCQNYVRACGVECCDESVQCVFTHSKAISASQTVTTQGYIPHDGPSSMCTGGARRAASPLGACFWAIVIANMFFLVDGSSLSQSMRQLCRGMSKKILLGSVLVVLALSMHGCDQAAVVDQATGASTHEVGNWRGQPDYLITNQFIPPGSSAYQAVINSCSMTGLGTDSACNGHGKCEMWAPEEVQNHLSFCKCDVHWVGAECRTRRKSQHIAFLLSMFGGLVGADQFYMGFMGLGVLKLCTLGGFGFWWIFDIIRIGSTQVYTGNKFRLAADLPHYVFVISSVMLAGFLGFSIAYIVTMRFRSKRRKEGYLKQMEDARNQEVGKAFAEPYGMGDKNYGSLGFGGMPPTNGAYAGMPIMGMGLTPPRFPMSGTLSRGPIA